MIEIIILIVLFLNLLNLARINYKLGRIADAAEVLNLAATNINEVELPCLTAAISEVARSFEDAVLPPILMNKN